MRSVSLTNENKALIGDQFMTAASKPSFFARLVEMMTTEFHRIAAYRSLTRFSDRELADIGLARHEIRDAVWGNDHK
ncbi:MAG: DUF1127 domain-containing protein [Alphaproteobacteria bacterium]|nr:DUF1127 domain-containing protein [Alphaproteobacteria bacterium]